MSFNIVKEQWEWAPAVKSQHIWRPDEYILTDSKETALKAIDWVHGQLGGNHRYLITVSRPDGFYTYLRGNMPCYGGLAKYLDSHGELHYMNPNFPRDIYVAFPHGVPVFITIVSQSKIKWNHDWQKFCLSEESPWIKAFNNPSSLILKDKYIVFTDMSADPTTLYSLLRLGDLFNNITTNAPKKYILNKIVSTDTKLALSHAADIRRIAGQNPIITSGGTWKDGYGYTRTFCEYIFSPSIPYSLSSFRGIKSYASISQNDFLSTADLKVPKDYNEAWEFYKKLGQEMWNIPGAKNEILKQQKNIVTPKWHNCYSNFF